MRRRRAASKTKTEEDLSFLKMSSAADLTIHQGQTRSRVTRRRIWKAVEALTTSIWSREIGATSTVTFNNRDLKTKLCDAFVTMVQAADLWKSNDPADGLYGP